MKEEGGNSNDNTVNENENDGHEIKLELNTNQASTSTSETETASPQLIQLLSKSKLRPTTRLMNSAIDACARSQQPSDRQTTAFHIFDNATSPLNAKDGSKKPGGALSPNVFTFGSLLACCARNGNVDTSLALLEVLEHGEKYPDVALNEVIYSTVISACERAEVPKVEIALRVLNRGISTLESGGGNEGGEEKKREGGGEKKKKKNRAKTKGTMGVVGYNAAISTMARAARWKMAVQLLGEMILHSHSSSTSSPLRTNPSFGPLESIRMEEEEGDKDGRKDHNGNTTSLAPLLHVVKNDGTTDNNIVQVPKPDEVTFGTVLAACERSGEWEELLNVAKAAKVYGVKLDGISLTSVLHSCQQLGLADEALQYLELMKHLDDDDGDECGDGNNNGSDKKSLNNIVHVAKQKTNRRQRKGARQPLRGPDGVAYRLAISACARCPGGHRWQDGIRLLDEMRQAAKNGNPDCAPDVVAYTAAIAGCSEAGEYTAGMQLISTMRSEGVQPNVVTFSAVINACASASAKLARRMEEEDNNNNYGRTSAVELEDVRMPMNRALRLLEAMKSPNSSARPNIVTYNAAIRACAEGLNLKGAFDLLRQLKEDGLEPTIVTYGSLMTACERVGDIEAASKVFRMVKQEEEEKKAAADDDSDNKDNHYEQLQVNEIIYGAAISCCRKAKQPERALLLLRKMISEQLSPNTATFNTVIAALSEGSKPDYAKNTNTDLLWQKALAVYKVMKSKHAPAGVAPNRQTYNILTRCLSANLQPGYAESMLNDMRKAGFVPDVDLYTLTVRSYERCGNPMKALSLMESMREVGYDFYEIKVLDEAFKSGIRILNRVGKIGHSTSEEGGIDYDEDMDYGGRRGVGSFALTDEIIDFNDDENDDDYQLIASLK
ncbi:hypothetical protein ACHAXR_004422 [Thalassiosira sp. AJA248-18]